MLYKEKIILLACGTFNPLHPMHLRMFELARDHLNQSKRFEVIGGIISPTHDTYKKENNAHLEKSKHRCNMIELSLQSSDWIRMSQWEISQPEWTTTLCVIKYHQKCIDEYVKHNADAEDMPTWMPPAIYNRNLRNIKIRLLCGTDFFESMANMTQWPVTDVRCILREYGIVVISRNETNLKRIIFESDIFYQYKGNIDIVDNFVMKDISSSFIRLLLKRGQSLKYMLNDDTIEYITTNNLYTTSRSASNLQIQQADLELTTYENSQDEDQRATQEFHDHNEEDIDDAMTQRPKRKLSNKNLPVKARK